MTYALAAPLQGAIYQRLANDAALQALVGTDIFDAMPEGTPPPLYVLLGAETVREAGDGTGRGAWHEIVVTVVTDAAGFQAAKDTAGVVSDALDGADLSLSRGALVGLWFRKARALRASGGLRRIDLTFRARVDDI